MKYTDNEVFHGNAPIVGMFYYDGGSWIINLHINSFKMP